MKRILAITILLLVVGCATTPEIPPELQYVLPSGSSESLATITGSQEDIALLDDLTAYVIAVDGKRVMAERKGWNEPLPILPGTRRITAAFQRGVFNTKAELPLEVVAGATYQIRFSSDVALYGSNTYCDFWIIDVVSQKPVTEIRRGLIRGGGETMIPIFIPAQ